AADHVANPSRLPSFEPVSDAFAVDLPQKSRAATLNRVCVRCHQVLFSGYDPTWEGGSRARTPGGSHINSGEARDLMLGACASKLTCVDCHDPHAADGTTALRALDAAAEDRLCTRCHEELAMKEAAARHSHHDPEREGGRCMACHMP